MAGEKCRTGCTTKNHRSYGECLRDAAPVINLRATPNNAWDRELETYRSAREQGIQPTGTTLQATRDALDISDHTGKAFDAGAGGPLM
jgi:hypothetical protein